MEQVMSRTKGFGIYDFNPTAEFWYHENVVGDPRFNTDLFISTYRDNEFVSEGIKRTLEMSKEGTNFWKVFNQGLMGSHDGIIFQNWTRGEMDYTLPYCYGVDFGYHPDPDAINKVSINGKEKKMYWEEKHYKCKNGTQEIIDACKRIIQNDFEAEKTKDIYRRYPWKTPRHNSVFVCDYAAGGSRIISDMSIQGINAIPCDKMPIQDRIKLMQDWEIIVCGESPNLERELNNYIYNDKKAGIPIDSFNHLIDAGYYGWGWLTGGANDGVHKR
jgi:phage terminase large subunit